MDASVNALSSLSWLDRSLTNTENAPDNEADASFAAVSVSAVIRSAMASACSRSILPLIKLRSENSPGRACLAPKSMQRESSPCKTMCPPCP